MLKNYLTARNLVSSLRAYDTFIIENRDTEVHFNNPCSMYNYYKLCMNNGVCKMSEELEPSCS
jgi:hypothetical protein